jgi:hypothetical protein
MGMGVAGAAAAVAGARQTDDMTWLAIWLGAAAVAAPVGFVAMIAKAQRHAVPLWSPAGRRFAQAFLPALLAAAVMTVLLVREGRFELLPPVWLLLYGAGVMAGAASSVPVLSLIGIAFFVCGAGAAVTAPAWGNLWLGTGFGACTSFLAS